MAVVFTIWVLYFNLFFGCNECGPGEGAHEVDAYADCRINKRRRTSLADAVNLVNWFETTPRGPTLLEMVLFAKITAVG